MDEQLYRFRPDQAVFETGMARGLDVSREQIRAADQAGIPGVPCILALRSARQVSEVVRRRAEE